jgi:hypothetical protein
MDAWPSTRRAVSRLPARQRGLSAIDGAVASRPVGRLQRRGAMQGSHHRCHAPPPRPEPGLEWFVAQGRLGAHVDFVETVTSAERRLVMYGPQSGHTAHGGAPYRNGRHGTGRPRIGTTPASVGEADARHCEVTPLARRPERALVDAAWKRSLLVRSASGGRGPRSVPSACRRGPALVDASGRRRDVARPPGVRLSACSYAAA